jgi:hypothetical protein
LHDLQPTGNGSTGPNRRSATGSSTPVGSIPVRFGKAKTRPNAAMLSAALAAIARVAL